MWSPQSLLTSRLDRPTSLSLSSWDRCFSPQMIFVNLLCTCSGRSMSFLHWEPWSWLQYSRQDSHENRAEGANHLSLQG